MTKFNIDRLHWDQKHIAFHQMIITKMKKE